MPWLIISIFAYFLSAIAALIDKILLSRAIPQPVVYAFYVSLFGLLVFLLAPFGFRFPPLDILIVSLIAGATFIFALRVFYSLLKKGEVSRIVPLVGGLVPFLVFVLAWILLQERLSIIQFGAFLLILAGTLLIMRERKKEKIIFPWQILLLSFLAAFLFALSHVLSKFVYVNFSFISGLIWRGVGGFLGGLFLLLLSRHRKNIIEAIKHSPGKASWLLIFGQGCGGVSLVLVNYAFSLGPISLVNALVGIQYIFLFLLVLAFSKKIPHLLKEKITHQIIGQKVLSLILISLGLFLLFL